MKTRLFLSAALAGLFFMTSCKSGPSDATKKSVAAFDSAWTEMGKQAMAMSDSLNACIAMCEKGCTIPDSCKGMCENMKMKCDSAMAPCKNDMKTFQDMKTAMDANKPMWDSAMTAFNAFKEKVNKGEINDADATKQLAEFQSKMDMGGKNMMDMMNKMMEAKSACMKNMSDCMEKCKNMKCTDKKCEADMKKKKA